MKLIRHRKAWSLSFLNSARCIRNLDVVGWIASRRKQADNDHGIYIEVAVFSSSQVVVRDSVQYTQVQQENVFDISFTYIIWTDGKLVSHNYTLLTHPQSSSMSPSTRCMNAISPTLASVCQRPRLYQAQSWTPLSPLHAVLDANCNIGHGFFLSPLLFLFLLNTIFEALLDLEVDTEFED